MDTSAWLQSLIEATHETTTLAPFDSRGSCPYCLGIFYDIVGEPETGIEEEILIYFDKQKELGIARIIGLFGLSLPRDSSC